jgi:hypothetical protein
MTAIRRTSLQIQPLTEIICPVMQPFVDRITAIDATSSTQPSELDLA